MKPAEAWQLAARAKLRRSIAKAVKPDERIWTDQWAENNRILPPDSPEAGPYRNARTPYLIDIQRTMSPSSWYREGWWMKPHQVGGSVTGENLIGSWICTAAGNMIVVFPTLDDGKQWELTRFEPMRASTPALARRIRPADEKGADNTKLRKKYPGGALRIIGANRIGAMKSATVRYVKFEEPDEYPVLPQGTLVGLVSKRTENFGRKAKLYGDGTPTFDGRSEIQRQVLRGDQRKWHLHCPDCGHAQPLVWEQVKWVGDDVETARYACIACGVLGTEVAWKEHNYRPRPPGMTEEEAASSGRAFWRATAVGLPGVASWCGLEALAAPLGWRPWPTLATLWIEAQGSDDKLREFINNYRGQPYQDRIRTETSAEQLQQRAEQYDMMTCPQGGLVITGGVDTQDNRLAVVLRAWGRGEESWGIWHGEIYGDPSSPETWGKLRELLTAPIRHASGQVMRVDAVAIDAGGHHAEDVLAFCRDANLRGRHWFAIRGHSSITAPKLGRPKTVDFTWRGRPVPGGAEQRMIGTQAIKNILDGRLKQTKPGGGTYHFPLGFQADYYKQMRSERRVWRRDMRGNKSLWWEKTAERNEAWDCEVYAYAAYLYAMSGRHADTVFRERERVFGERRQLELLDDGAVVPHPAAAAAMAAAAPDNGDQAHPGQVGPGDGQAAQQDQQPEPEAADQPPPPAESQLVLAGMRQRSAHLQHSRRKGFARRW